MSREEVFVKLALEADETNKKLADLLWNNPDGKDVKEAYDMARSVVDDEKLVTALNGLKSSISDFITHLEQGLGQSKGKKTTRQQIKEEEETGDVMTSAPPLR